MKWSHLMYPRVPCYFLFSAFFLLVLVSLLVTLFTCVFCRVFVIQFYITRNHREGARIYLEEGVGEGEVKRQTFCHNPSNISIPERIERKIYIIHDLVLKDEEWVPTISVHHRPNDGGGGGVEIVGSSFVASYNESNTNRGRKWVHYTPPLHTS